MIKKITYTIVSGLIAVVIGACVSIIIGGTSQTRVISWAVTAATVAIILGISFSIKN